jgi:endogenous inhibitor of DNA gyrase (YacG/DUF329 family)
MPLVVRCPICQVEVSWEGNPTRPFCSERCRLVDLGAWAQGTYRVPGEEIEDESGEGNGDPDEGSA